VTAAAAVFLVPWTVGIAAAVPHSVVARHWNTAWAGLDAAIVAGLTVTCWLRRHRDQRAAVAATATATLMCADAWFDMCTSAPGLPLVVAAGLGAIELLVAVACLRSGYGAGTAPDGGNRPARQRGAQSTIPVTTPTATVRLPSRTAKPRPASIAIGRPNSTVRSTVSPGSTIVRAPRSTEPGTSVVRK
jgi:hypothetical protein